MNIALRDMASVPASRPEGVERVRRLEDEILKHQQREMHTDHVFHAGCYARTIHVPKGMVLIGAMIKIPTILIVNGDCVMSGGDVPMRLTGYNVLMASAGRKQAYVANEDISITMVFATQSKTVEEAEQEFTEDYKMLLSNKGTNVCRSSKVQS